MLAEVHKPARDRNEIQVLIRAMNVMDHVAAYPGCSIQETAQATGIHVSTVYRIIHTLCEQGWLLQDEDRHLWVGERVAQIGAAYSPLTTLLRIARPVMQRLSVTLQETIGLAVRRNLEIEYVEQIRYPRPFAISVPVHEPLPIYCTASGRVILAGLNIEEREALLSMLARESLTPWTARTVTNLDMLRAQVEEALRRGFAVERGESSSGGGCIAVPLMGPDGHTVAALSTTGVDLARLSVNETRIAEALLVAKQRIEDQLRR